MKSSFVTLILSLLLIANHAAFSQRIKKKDRNKLKKLTEQQDALLKSYSFDESADISRQIFDISQKYKQGFYFQKLSETALKFSEYKAGSYFNADLIAAKKQLDSEADTNSEIYRDILFSLGNNYFQSRQYDLAHKCFSTLQHGDFSFDDPERERQLYKTLSFIKIDQGHADAYDLFGKTIDIYKNDGKLLELADLYLESTEYLYKQNPKLALMFVGEAQKIFKETKGANNQRRAEIAKSKGLLYIAFGDFKTAQNFFSRAVFYAENTQPLDEYLLQATYSNKAMTFSFLRQVDSLGFYARKAYKLCQKLYPSNSLQTSVAFGNLSNMYLNQRNLDSALIYREKALEIQESIHGKKGMGIASQNYRLSMIYIYKGQLIEALKYAHLSLTNILDHVPNDTNWQSFPEIEGDFNINGALMSVSQKIYLTEQLFKMTKDSIWMEWAHKNYVYIDTLVHILQQGFLDKDLAALIKINTQNYNNATDNAYFLYQNDPTETYFERTYYFATALKAKMLAYQLYKLEKSKESKGPTAQSTALVELESEIRELQNQLQTLEPGSQKTPGINSEILLKSLEQQALISHITLQNQDRSVVSLQNFSLDTDSLQANMNDKTALIEYFFGNSQLYIFCFTKKRKYIRTVAYNNELKKDISGFIINIKKGKRFPDRNIDLGLHLIEPIYDIIRDKSHLVIIPDDRLFSLPFEALFQPGEDLYLVESHQISYHYSAALWLRSKSHQNKEIAPSISLFAPGFQEEGTSSLASNSTYRGDTSLINKDILRSNGKDLTPLPFSINEVESIQKTTKSNWNASLFIGIKASEKNLRDKANNNKIIHLATHGFSSNIDSRKSGLFLSPGAENGDHTNDGILYIGELFNSGFNADLVVLSACRSGTGQILEGEGLYGLPRGFIYAGALNVIASLWKVHDEKTSDLMLHFYEEYMKTGNYSKALQEAKIKMIRSGELPVDWSGIILIGR